MNVRRSLRTWLLVAAACIGTAIAVRWLFPSKALADESDVYRVEMVHNDPYKIQVGLNSLMKQGWYYVGSIDRNDGKVLLIFRKTTE